jgi:hypothetical protein
LQAQIESQGVGRFRMSPEFERVGHDVLVASTEWETPEGAPDRRYAVLTIRDGKIADMQVCGTRRDAKRFARRAA